MHGFQMVVLKTSQKQKKEFKIHKKYCVSLTNCWKLSIIVALNINKIMEILKGLKCKLFKNWGKSTNYGKLSTTAF